VQVSPTEPELLKTSIDRAMKRGLARARDDVNASIDRANQLLQLNTARSVRNWAAVTFLVSAGMLVGTVLLLRH
jgi:hypothetical protein